MCNERHRPRQIRCMMLGTSFKARFSGPAEPRLFTAHDFAGNRWTTTILPKTNPKCGFKRGMPGRVRRIISEESAKSFPKDLPSRIQLDSEVGVLSTAARPSRLISTTGLTRAPKGKWPNGMPPTPRRRAGRVRVRYHSTVSWPGYNAIRR